MGAGTEASLISRHGETKRVLTNKEIKVKIHNSMSGEHLEHTSNSHLKALKLGPQSLYFFRSCLRRRRRRRRSGRRGRRGSETTGQTADSSSQAAVTSMRACLITSVGFRCSQLSSPVSQLGVEISRSSTPGLASLEISEVVARLDQEGRGELTSGDIKELRHIAAKKRSQSTRT